MILRVSLKIFRYREKLESRENLGKIWKNFSWDKSRVFGKTPISGFQVKTGSQKYDVAQFQGQSYKPPKFHPNRPTGKIIGKDRIVSEIATLVLGDKISKIVFMFNSGI